MERLDLTTPNFTDENIQKLSELFPNCVTESADGKAIDFDALKQELSSNIIKGNKERYQLTWPGKAESLVTANTPINKSLRPVRAESKDFDNTENLYIEGDNLEVLKLLQETYLGKIKMIYIDPPYNTGKDFVYKDNFTQDKAEYDEESGNVDDEGGRLVSNPDSNGRYHSDWLSMMYPRLKLARNLLKDDGVIFISIDEVEQSNLKKICDEIFGEKNFVNNLIWQSRTSISNDQEISLNHNHTLVYAKKLEELLFYGVPLDPSDYSNPDNDSRGAWKLVPIDANKPGGDTNYGIVNPNTGEEYFPPNGRSWAINKRDFNKLLDDGRIKFGMSDNSSPKKKLYYEERMLKGDTKTPSSILLDAGSTKTGTTELMGLFENMKLFDYPKPTTLLSRLLSFGCSKDSDDIILDFFAGSGSTSHALLKYNKEYSTNHKFISVQLPENLEESIKTASGLTLKTIQNSIAFLKKRNRPLLLTEISKERIRRAGEKIKVDNADKEGIKDLDTGFRVLKVDSSNMKDVYFSPDNTSQDDMFDLASNIKDDRTDEDLLFMVLLDWGIDLSVKIERREVAGKTVYFADDNFLAACFEENLDEDFVKALVVQQPLKVVLRDSGFASSSVKINVEQIFKQADIEVKVI
ncbi:site-specific DNA-methyltransferase [Candidatus Thioglobus autotrophicus]|uniref:site-specific DNA-methyltransferase n=1 Tax=Candidatus Thioglobus autotrophicus TaxID=1705394 RepID=UPI00299D8F87|nr:site-specific DNA-methyltransferase [Candidatus Thioglobus autotrophicus]WPE18715.1 site-specific DNA-methyltransferase [Candidatus Thioglobus autotrophicus]